MEIERPYRKTDGRLTGCWCLMEGSQIGDEDYLMVSDDDNLLNNDDVQTCYIFASIWKKKKKNIVIS